MSELEKEILPIPDVCPHLPECVSLVTEDEFELCVSENWIYCKTAEIHVAVSQYKKAPKDWQKVK